MAARTNEGKLADNIAYFVRTLRKAGLRIGPAATLTAIEAARATGLDSRDDVFWALRSVLVSRREDGPVFEEAFRLFWRPRELTETMIAMLSPRAPPRDAQPEKKRAGATRATDALLEGAKNLPARQERPEIEIDARLTASGDEVLRAKDFAQMSADELAVARRAMASLRLPDDLVATRRFRAAPSGGRLDPARTMRASIRSGGDLILPKFRSPRLVHPPLVVIADISGSMSQYTRVFLHFLHALAERRRRVHTFLFGTRLTNVSRALRHRDPDEALETCAAAVKDWSGGTRIGEAIGAFNRLWSRRVLPGGAVVLLITDGLERDDVEDLRRQMARLHRSCRRLIWLNPLLRYEGFAARARGVRAMLPHVDEFRSIHSLNSLAELSEALSATGGRGTDPRRWLADFNAAEAA